MNCEKFRCVRKFSTNSQPHLSGHRLNGSVVVSGATVLTSIAEFIEEQHEYGAISTGLQFHDVFFCRPVVIENGRAEVDVDVEWDQQRGSLVLKDTAGQICAVCSRIVSNSTSDSESAVPFSSKFYTPDIIQKSVDAEEFYSFMRQFGYEYADSFRSVNEVRLLIEPSNSEDKQTMSYGMCKMNDMINVDAVIDGTFQAMVHAMLQNVKESKMRSMIVPFSTGKSNLRISQRQRIPLKNVYALFRVCSEKHIGDCFIKANGDELFSAENLYFRPIRDAFPVNGESCQANLPCENECSDQKADPKYGIRAMSCRLPGNINSPADFWQLLVDGRVTDRRIPADRIPTRNNLIKNGCVEGGNFITQNVEDFDAAFFGISRAEAEAMDPQQRVLLECIYECMENAKLNTLAGPTGFFVGLMGTEYPDIVEAAARRDMLAMLGSSASIIAGRLNYCFDGTGPAICVDTACSSSLTCIDLAIQSIKAGRCQRAVVAGVNLILTEKGLQQRANGKMLSWDGVCRTFDANASGYGRADGCVAIIIEEVSEKRQYEAIIESIHLNHDGRSTALTAPNPAAQTRLISKCVDQLGSGNLLFWECHGTGTPLGDPIEYVALYNALSQKINEQSQYLFISSAKASMGHCEAASGLVGVLKAVLQLQNDYIPRLPRFSILNEQIRKQKKSQFMLKLPICGTELFSNGFGGVSSFGVSGTNACVILSLPKTNQLSYNREFCENFLTVLPISGKSADAMNNNLFRCMDTMKCRSEQQLTPRIMQYCHTYALSRPHYKHRACLIFIKGRNRQVSPQIIRKSIGKITHFKLALSLWPTFELDLLCKIPTYRHHLLQVLASIRLSLMEALQIKNRNTLLVVDFFAKYKMLIDWAIPIENFVDELNDKSDRFKFALALRAFIDKPEANQLKECLRFVEMSSTENNVKDIKGTYNLIGPDAEFSIDSVNAIQQLLAISYTNGHSLNWNAIYPLNSCLSLNIHLPNYAFNRNAYWITKRPKLITHELMGSVVDETEDYVTFENLVSINRLPFLGKVNSTDEQIFPLGATLEIIIAAAYNSMDVKTDEGIRITNIALHKLIELQSADFWLSTTVNKRFSKLEMLVGEQKIPFGNANFCNVKNLRKEKWKLPEIHQKIDDNQFKAQIIRNSKIDYRNFDLVDVFLDPSCNIIKIATEFNPLTGCDYMINPVLLETFAQILLNYGVIKEYNVIIQRIKMIEVFKRIDRFCFINIDDNVIESFDENQDLAMRVVLDLSVTNAESNILSLPITRRQHHSESEDIGASQTVKLKHHEILHRIMNALEDSVALESPLDEDSINTGFVDIGLDSLSLVGLLNKLNKEYFPDIGITSTDLFTHPTIAALASFIDGKQLANHRTIETFQGTHANWPLEMPTSNNVNDDRTFEDESIHAYTITHKNEVRFDSMRFKITVRTKNNDLINAQLCLNDVPKNNWSILLSQDDNSFRPVIEEIRDKSNFKNHVTIQLKFIDDYLSLQSATKLLLLFSKTCLKTDKLPHLRFYIPQIDSLSIMDGMARGFLKCLAAEKPDKFSFIFEQKLQRIRNLEVSLPCPAPCGAWLITGGTSGIGFEMAEYMALNYNVSYIGLIGRHRIENCELIERLKQMQRFCDVEFLLADVCNYEELLQAFEKASSHVHVETGIDGIIHSAGCVRDCRIELLSTAIFEEVLRPKCSGIQNLERCLEELNYHPTFFIMNSSISSTFGNPTQCNYGAANAWTDEYIRYRRSRGLSGTTIHWGNWLDTGMAARLGVNALLNDIGFCGLTSTEAMKYFRYVLESNPEAIVVANIDWKVLLSKRKDLEETFENKNTNNFRGAELASQPMLKVKQLSAKIDVMPKANLDGVPKHSVAISMRKCSIHTVGEVRTIITQLLMPYINETKDFEVWDSRVHSMGFIELGLDSLKLYLFAADVQREFSQYTDGEFTVTVIDLFQNPTINKLTEYIFKKIIVNNSAKWLSTDEKKRKISEFISSSDIISNQNFEMISQHRVDNEIIIPAAFQIRQFENYFRLKNENGSDGDTVLKSITFKNPIDLKNLGYVSVRERQIGSTSLISLVSNTDDEAHFSSCTINNPDRISEEKAANFLDDIRRMFRSEDQRFRKLNENTFYIGMREHGIDYGEKFRLLRNLKILSNSIEAEIFKESDNLLVDKSNWRLYDVALQALSAIVFDPTIPYYYVPVQIDLFWCKGTKNWFQNQRSATCEEESCVKVYGRILKKEEHFLIGTVAIIYQDNAVIFMESVTAIRRSRTHPTRAKNRKNAVPNEEDIRRVIRFFSNNGDEEDKTDGLPKNNGNITDEKGNQNKVKTKYEEKDEIVVVGWSNMSKMCVENLAESYDAEFFHINAKEAPFVDPQQRLLLEAVREAMECAEIQNLPPETGVFIGGSSSDFAQRAYAELEANGYMAVGTNNSVLSGRVAHFIGATADVETVDAACSSFSVALACACDALRAERCTYAVVGAVNVLINSKTTEVLRQLGVLSANGHCATFDADADGYMRNSAVGAIILQRVDRTTLKMYRSPMVRISGWSTGHAGADSASMTASSTIAQCRVIQTALEQAGLTEVDLIECHGSATSLGDPIEAASILETFNTTSLLMLNASKTQYGHCEAAAGIVSFFEAIKTIMTGRLNSFNHFKCMNPRIRAMSGAEKILLPIVGIEARISSILINNFAFNGANAAIVLTVHRPEEIQEDFNVVNEDDLSESPSGLLLLSAKSRDSLTASRHQLKQYLCDNFYRQRRAMKAFSRVSLHGRCHYRPYRLAYVINYIQSPEVQLKQLDYKTDSKYHVDIVLIPEPKKSSIFSTVAMDELVRNHRGFNAFYEKYRHEYCDSTIQEVFNLMIAEFLAAFISTHQTISIAFHEDDERLYFENHGSKSVKDILNHMPSRQNNRIEIDFSEIASLKNRPSFMLNKIFGRLFVANIPLNVEIFDPKPLVFGQFYDFKVPGYAFNRKRYWPFKDDKIVLTNEPLKPCASRKDSIGLNKESYPLNISGKADGILKISAESQHEIETSDLMDEPASNIGIYRRIFEPFQSDNFEAVSDDNSFNSTPIINFRSDKITFPIQSNIEEDEWILKHIKDESVNDLLIIWDDDMDDDEPIINNFMRMGQFLSALNRMKLMRLLVLVELKDGTNVPADSCEIVAFLRSAGAECSNLVYRVISTAKQIAEICTHDFVRTQFGVMHNPADSAHLLITANGEVLVERLTLVSNNFSALNADLEQLWQDRPVRKAMITGGGGGLAREMIRYLNAESIVTVSRQKHQSFDDPRVHHYEADCSDFVAMRDIFRNESGIAVIFHCAGVVYNKRMENLRTEDFRRVFAPKIGAARVLLKCCVEFGVRDFLAISSAAGTLGFAGQANYASANARMERACAESYRGVRARAIAIGPVCDVGMLAPARLAPIRRQIVDAGWLFLRAADVTSVVTKSVEINGSVGAINSFMIFAADWPEIRRQQPHLSEFLLHCNYGSRMQPLLKRSITFGSNQANISRSEFIPENTPRTRRRYYRNFKKRKSRLRCYRLVQNNSTDGSDHAQYCTETGDKFNGCDLPGDVRQYSTPVNQQCRKCDKQYNIQTEQTTINRHYDQHIDQSRISAELQALVRQISGLADPQLDVGLMAMGMDSLMVEELRTAAARRYPAITITIAEMYTHVTIDDLAELIYRKITENRGQNQKLYDSKFSFIIREQNATVNKAVTKNNKNPIGLKDIGSHDSDRIGSASYRSDKHKSGEKKKPTKIDGFADPNKVAKTVIDALFDKPKSQRNLNKNQPEVNSAYTKIAKKTRKLKKAVPDIVTSDKQSKVKTENKNGTNTVIEEEYLEEENGLYEDDVAIIGISGTFSGSRSVDELWANLMAGRECTTRIGKHSKNYEDRGDKGDSEKDQNLKSDENQKDHKYPKGHQNNEGNESKNDDMHYDTSDSGDSSDDSIDYSKEGRKGRGVFVPVSGVVPDSEAFDTAPFAALSAEDAQMLDPHVRCAVTHAYAALEHSSYIRQRTKLRVGCFFGAEPSGFVHSTAPPARKATRGSLTAMFARNQKDFCAAWISYLLDLRGPSTAVYAACATALVALRQASDALTRGDADLCLAGSAHLIAPDDVGHQYVPGMVLAPHAHCRPFAGRRDGGILRGSGCALVVLKNARAAYRDGDHILGVLRACELTNDGAAAKSNFMAPSAHGQVAAMGAALARAAAKRVSRADVAYLECHATGTFVGDAVELRAVADAFIGSGLGTHQPDHQLLVGSLKANIGHAFAAAGMASLAKCLKILETGIVPPQLDGRENFADRSSEESDPLIRVAYSAGSPEAFARGRLRCVALNSFGIGGTNACAILSTAPPLRRGKSASKALIDGEFALLPISAASPAACVRACRAIASHVRQIGDASCDAFEELQKVARTLQFRRERYRWRVAILARHPQEAAEKLSRVDEADVTCAFDGAPLGADRLAAYFAPQGVQYPNMLRAELRCSAWLRGQLGQLNAYFDSLNEIAGLSRSSPSSNEANEMSDIVDKTSSVSGPSKGTVLKNCKRISSNQDVETIKASNPTNRAENRSSCDDGSSVMPDLDGKANESLNGKSARSGSIVTAPKSAIQPAEPQSLSGQSLGVGSAFGTPEVSLARVLATDAVDDARYTQCALYAVCRVAGAFLAAATGGDSAALLFGHSMGEYTALAAAGALTDAQAMRLLRVRGALIAETQPAKMLIAYEALSGATAAAAAAAGVEESARLSDRMRVLVGAPAAVDALRDTLKAEGRQCRPLRTAHGFHSSLLEPILDRFEAAAAEVLDGAQNSAFSGPPGSPDSHNLKDLGSYESPNVPSSIQAKSQKSCRVISNMDGTAVDVHRLTAAYLREHMRRPVRLDRSVDAILAAQPAVCAVLEVGPSGLLDGLIQRRLAELDQAGSEPRRVVAVSTMQSRFEAMRCGDTTAPLFEAVARLWTLGFAVDFARLCGGAAAQFDYALPGYQFEARILPAPARQRRHERCDTPKVFRQGFKLVGDLGMVAAPALSHRRILFMTNSESAARNFTSSIATVLLRYGNTEFYRKLPNRIFEIYAESDDNFSRVGTELRAECFDALVHYFENPTSGTVTALYGSDATVNQWFCGSAVGAAFAALRRAARHFGTLLADGARVYSLAAPLSFQATVTPPEAEDGVDRVARTVTKIERIPVSKATEVTGSSGTFEDLGAPSVPSVPSGTSPDRLESPLQYSPYGAMAFGALSALRHEIPHIGGVALVEGVAGDAIAEFLARFTALERTNPDECADFEWFRLARGGVLTRLFYEPEEICAEKFSGGGDDGAAECALLLGGAGDVGRAFARVIRRRWPAMRLIVASRRATEAAAHFGATPAPIFVDVDLADAAQVDALFARVRRVGRCRFVVHCAGVPPDENSLRLSAAKRPKKEVRASDTQSTQYSQDSEAETIRCDGGNAPSPQHLVSSPNRQASGQYSDDSETQNVPQHTTVTSSKQQYPTTKSISYCSPEFAAKVYGTRNVLGALRKWDGGAVDALVLNSSLSAVNGLPGVAAYASANIFLDALAADASSETPPHVARILSVQWPAWRASQMFRASRLSRAGGAMRDAAIGTRSAEHIIDAFLADARWRGVLAVTARPPREIRRYFYSQIGSSLDYDSRAYGNNNSSENAADTNLKEILRAVWSASLRGATASPSERDDFFALGGDSLSAVQLAWRVERALHGRVHVPPDWLFEFARFDLFCARIEAALGERVDPDERANYGGAAARAARTGAPIPLSLPQEQMWLLWRLNRGRSGALRGIYNIVFRVDLSGAALDQRVIEHAWRRVLAAQPALRTRILGAEDPVEGAVTSGPRQEVLSLTESFLAFRWRALGAEAENAAISALECAHDFDLGVGPPTRLRALYRTGGGFSIYFNHHHIATDGWSVGVFARQFAAFYRAADKAVNNPDTVKPDYNCSATVTTVTTNPSTVESTNSATVNSLNAQSKCGTTVPYKNVNANSTSNAYCTHETSDYSRTTPTDGGNVASYSHDGTEVWAGYNMTYADYALWNRRQFEDHATQQKLLVFAERLRCLPPGGTVIEAREARHSWSDIGAEKYGNTKEDYGSAEDYGSVEVDLLEREKCALDDFCAAARTTRHTVMLAAFLRAVDIWRADAGAQADAPTPLVVGCAVAGRAARQLDVLVGYFLNNMVLVVDPAGSSDQGPRSNQGTAHVPAADAEGPTEVSKTNDELSPSGQNNTNLNPNAGSELLSSDQKFAECCRSSREANRDCVQDRNPADGGLWASNPRHVAAYVRRCVDAAKAFADVPFHRAVALMQTRRAGLNPVFQIFFNYRHDLDFPRADLGPNAHATIAQISRNRVFPLACTVDEIRDERRGDERVRLTLDHAVDALDAPHARSFLDEVAAQLRTLCASPSAENAAEELTASADVCAPCVTLVAALRAQVRRTPARPAICRLRSRSGAPETLSYAQLWSRAGAQARWLRRCHLRATGAPLAPRDAVLPLVFADGNAAVAWILSAARCRAAYAFIDARQPAARIAALLGALDVRLAVSDAPMSAGAAPTGCAILNVNAPENAAELAQEYSRDYDRSGEICGGPNVADDADASALAYVCFTSGTTGVPKGVCVEQRQLMAFVGAATRRLGVDAAARVAHSVSCAFDVSAFNIFGALLNGACLVQADSVMDFVAPLPAELSQLASSTVSCSSSTVHANAIRVSTGIVTATRPLSHLFLNSAVFNALNDAELRRVAGQSAARLIVGGETPATRALRLCAPLTRLTQIYGPTEATVWSLVQRVTAENCDGALIGKVQADECAFLVHASNRAVRLAHDSLAAGELCLAGAGVARGYLRGDARADGAFVELPGLGRVYRTGDLVRRVPRGDQNGALPFVYRFLCRNDARLKIGGVRVDPAEVRDACERAWRGAVFVTGEQGDGIGEVELVAYLVLEGRKAHIPVLEDPKSSDHVPKDIEDSDPGIDVAILALRDALANALPANGRPSAFIPVDRLPLNRVGKVDRAALSALYREWRAKFAAPSPPIRANVATCARLAAIWRDVLRLDGVPACDANFFALGGHSLLLFALKRAIRAEFAELGEAAELGLDELYHNASLAHQARVIAGRLAAQHRTNGGTSVNETESDKSSARELGVLMTQLGSNKPPEISLDTTTEVDITVPISLLRAPASGALPATTLDVYCIHAIGGTLYPYYPILHVFPPNWRIFGIHFDNGLRAGSLDELARHYARQILAEQPSLLRRPFLLLGHSLGGILAREIAILINAVAPRPRFLPFVVAIDSWALGTAALDLDVVRAYLIEQFRLMPESTRLLEGAMRLARWLKEHKFARADVGVRLFKANSIGQHSLRRCIRGTEFSDSSNDAEATAARDSGWSALVAAPAHLELFPCDGDHDTILRADALAPHRDAFAHFYADLVDSV